MTKVELEQALSAREKELRELKKLLGNKGWREADFEGVRRTDNVNYVHRLRQTRQRESTKIYDQAIGLEQRLWNHEPIANFSALIKALGMSKREFGLCYGMSRQGVEGMLEREMRWAIQLDTMWRMAESVGCELVVRVRPKNGYSALEMRKMEAYRLKRSQGKDEQMALMYAEAVGRGAKMDWANWALKRRKGEL